MDASVCASEHTSLESFGKSIQKAMSCASAYDPGTSVQKRIPIAVLTAHDRTMFEDAHTLDEKISASRALSHARKRIKRQRIAEDFEANALRAPRDDKKQLAANSPITVVSAEAIALAGSSNPSFRADVWELEFRSLYQNLLGDPHNPVPVQKQRLESLRDMAAGTPFLHVSVHVVYEVLSQAGRKQRGAVGTDGISWGALGCLPSSAVAILHRLIESRINAVHAASGLIQDWCQVIVTLIPKIRKTFPR
jgi:hypothetical protein